MDPLLSKSLISPDSLLRVGRLSTGPPKPAAGASGVEQLADGKAIEAGNPIDKLAKLAGVDAKDIKNLTVSMNKGADGKWDVGSFLAPPDNKPCLKANMVFTAELEGGRKVELIVTRFTSVPVHQSSDSPQAAEANMTKFMRAIESDARGFEALFAANPADTTGARATNINTFVNSNDTISRVRTQTDTAGSLTVSHEWSNTTGKLTLGSTSYKVADLATKTFGAVAQAKTPQAQPNVTQVNPQQCPLSHEMTTIAKEIVSQFKFGADFPADIEEAIGKTANDIKTAIGGLDFKDAAAVQDVAAKGARLAELSQDKDIKSWMAASGPKPDAKALDHLYLNQGPALKKVGEFCALRNELMAAVSPDSLSDANKALGLVAHENPVNTKILASLDPPTRAILTAMQGAQKELKETEQALGEIGKSGVKQYTDPEDAQFEIAEKITVHAGSIEQEVANTVNNGVSDYYQTLPDWSEEQTTGEWMQDLAKKAEGPPADQKLADFVTVATDGPDREAALGRLREGFQQSQLSGSDADAAALKQEVWQTPHTERLWERTIETAIKGWIGEVDKPDAFAEAVVKATQAHAERIKAAAAAPAEPAAQAAAEPAARAPPQDAEADVVVQGVAPEVLDASATASLIKTLAGLGVTQAEVYTDEELEAAEAEGAIPEQAASAPLAETAQAGAVESSNRPKRKLSDSVAKLRPASKKQRLPPINAELQANADIKDLLAFPEAGMMISFDTSTGTFVASNYRDSASTTRTAAALLSRMLQDATSKDSFKVQDLSSLMKPLNKRESTKNKRESTNENNVQLAKALIKQWAAQLQSDEVRKLIIDMRAEPPPADRVKEFQDLLSVGSALGDKYVAPLRKMAMRHTGKSPEQLKADFLNLYLVESNPLMTSPLIRLNNEPVRFFAPNPPHEPIEKLLTADQYLKTAMGEWNQVLPDAAKSSDDFARGVSNPQVRLAIGALRNGAAQLRILDAMYAAHIEVAVSVSAVLDKLADETAKAKAANLLTPDLSAMAVVLSSDEMKSLFQTASRYTEKLDRFNAETEPDSISNEALRALNLSRSEFRATVMRPFQTAMRIPLLLDEMKKSSDEFGKQVEAGPIKSWALAIDAGKRANELLGIQP